jgi:hypothetical protein
MGALTAPDSNGRGTASLTDSTGLTTTYIYYVIDPMTLNFLETDSGRLGGGVGLAQSATPFNNSSLKSGFAFHSRGETMKSVNGVTSAGALTSDGNGNITGGSYDSQQDGVPIPDAALTGTYNVDSSGRVTVTLNPTLGSQVLTPIQEVGRMVNTSQALFLVNVPGRAEDGRMDQQSGSFSNAALKGTYSFLMFGYDAQNPVEIDRVGAMKFDGSSAVTLTDYFINRSGSRNQTSSVPGTYTVSPNGRISASVGGVTSALVIYLTSGTSGNLVLGDTGSQVSGNIAQPAASSSNH